MPPSQHLLNEIEIEGVADDEEHPEGEHDEDAGGHVTRCSTSRAAIIMLDYLQTT